MPKAVTQSTFLTLYGKLACMCDSITSQRTTTMKREMAGVYYASLVNMMEAWWRLVGLRRVGNAFALYCPHGAGPRPTVGTNPWDPGSRVTVDLDPTKFCLNFDDINRAGYRGDATVVRRIGGVLPPQWTTLVRNLSPEVLVRYIKHINDVTVSKQDKYWTWRSNISVAPPRAIDRARRTSSGFRAITAWDKIPTWAYVVGGLAIAGGAGYLIVRK